MTFGEELGLALRKKRVELGMTQVELAHMVSLQGAAISKFELGQRSITVEMFCNIYTAYAAKRSEKAK